MSDDRRIWTDGPWTWVEVRGPDAETVLRAMADALPESRRWVEVFALTPEPIGHPHGLSMRARWLP